MGLSQCDVRRILEPARMLSQGESIRTKRSFTSTQGRSAIVSDHTLSVSDGHVGSSEFA